MMRYFALWVLAGLSASCLRADVTAYDFARAASYSRTHGGVGVRVIQHDQVVFEDYADGYDEDTPHKIYSGTKNFVALAMMVAIQRDHFFSGLNEPVSDTLTEWRHGSRRDITIRQLLTQSAGLSSGFSEICNCSDQLAAAVHVPLLNPVGTAFHYGPTGYQAAGEMLRRKLRSRDESVEDYIHRTVLDKIGIDVAEWKKDNSGEPLLHTGMHLSTHQWGKLGIFLLQQLRAPQPDFPDIRPMLVGTWANPAYGISFWLNAPLNPENPQKIDDLQVAIDGDMIYPGGPIDLFACIGSGKQRLYIIPSKDLVVVRFGSEAPFSDGDFLSRLLTGKAHPDAHSH